MTALSGASVGGGFHLELEDILFLFLELRYSFHHNNNYINYNLLNQQSNTVDISRGNFYHTTVKVKSSMARSLPVEDLLPQKVGSIINYFQ